MKSSLFTLLLMLTISAVSAQEYKATTEGWLVNLEEAAKISQETGKPIMANFTGSDWCGWCKRLKKNVFVEPAFKKWAEDNVVLLELDYPRRTKLPEEFKRQNAGLQQAFQVRGYPTVWVFNISKNETSGKFELAPLGKTGYAKTVDQFTSTIDQMIDKVAVSN